MTTIKHKLFQVLSFLYPITIKTYESAFSGKIELTYEYGSLVVNTTEANYSYGSLHEVFRSVMKKLHFKQEKSKVLILGFGAGSIAQILVKEYKLPVEIDGVELDVLMLQLYDKYFQLKTSRLTLHNQDVIVYLEENDQKYDYIFIDVFDNLQVPDKVLSQDFIKLLQDASNDKTQIAMNTMLDEKHPFVRKWIHFFGNQASVRSYDVNNLVLFKLPSN